MRFVHFAAFFGLAIPLASFAGGTASIALPSEPAQLDSTRATEIVSNWVLGHVMEGLTRYGRKAGEVIPGIADRWSLDEKSAVFHIRQDARWSDGKPVTAHDFVFAWRKAVDPKNASPYAFILYPVKGAAAIAAGKRPVAELGVAAADDYTLKVELEKPCPYFLSLTAYTTYFPIREGFYAAQNGRYGADASALLYDGPFTLKAWSHGASLRLEKNPAYWRAGEVDLQTIDVPAITEDAGAVFNLYKDHRVDYVTLPSQNELKLAQAEHYRIQTFSQGELAFLRFNFRPGRPTANADLRRAIRAVIDTRELASVVVGIPGTKPGRGLIPESMTSAAGNFRAKFPLEPWHRDLASARRWVGQARARLGGQIPPLTLLTIDTPRARREAEYLQNALKKELGIELKIDVQIAKQSIAKAFAGDFDLAASSWIPDYQDPMAYAEILTSWNKNNRGRYESAEYDRLIKEAQSTSDAKRRFRAVAKAEKRALDDVAILPTWETVEAYVVNPRLKGLVRREMGADPDLSFASISGP